jgi:hypothetical protein
MARKRGRKVKVQLSQRAAHAIFTALSSAIAPTAFHEGAGRCSEIELDEAHARELSKAVAALGKRAPKQSSTKQKKKK